MAVFAGGERTYSFEELEKEYIQLRGEKYSKPSTTPILYGSPPESALFAMHDASSISTERTGVDKSGRIRALMTLETFTAADLLDAESATGLTVTGVSEIERENNRRWRFGLGPETQLTFNATGAKQMHLSFQMINLLPTQSISIRINGAEMRLIEFDQKGHQVTDTIEFESTTGHNEIHLVYADWNHRQTAHFPKDQRPIAINIVDLVIE